MGSVLGLCRDLCWDLCWVSSGVSAAVSAGGQDVALGWEHQQEPPTAQGQHREVLDGLCCASTFLHISKMMEHGLCHHNSSSVRHSTAQFT